MAEYAVDTQVLVRFMEGKRAPSPAIQNILIGATAVFLDIPLLTNDPDLVASRAIATI